MKKYTGHGQRGIDLRAHRDTFYDYAYPEYSTYAAEAQIDGCFEAGQTSIYDDIYRDVPGYNDRVFNFNHIRSAINVLSGNQRQTRTGIIVKPVENGDQETADQYSKVIAHVMRSGQVLNTESNAFTSSLIHGLSLLQVWKDHSKDWVSGDIKVDALDYNMFLIDPYFKKIDLSDCTGIWKRSYITQSQAKILWPGNDKDINELMTRDIPSSQLDFINEPLQAQGSRLAYDEYYYSSTKKKKFAKDLETDSVLDFDPETVSEEELSQFLYYNDNIEIAEFEVPTVKMAMFINDELIYDGDNSLGIDEYPFVPILSYFRPSLDTAAMRIQSAVRGMRDIQFLYDRMMAKQDKIVSSRITPGLIFKPESVRNVDDVYQVGEGKNIPLSTEGDVSDISTIPVAPFPAETFQITENLGREFQLTTGINEELLAMATDDKAAILAKLRQGASLVALRPLYDNIDQAKEVLGRILLKSIQKNFTPEKVARIIEEEPTQQFYNKEFGVYDAVVTSGFDTDTQRQQGLLELLELKTVHGLNIPDSVIIEATSIQNKAKLIKSIEEANQQTAQAEQAQMQTQEELISAESEKSRSQSELNLSKAKEADSKVYYNITSMLERKSEADKDKTQAFYNDIKSLNEINSGTLDNYSKLVQLKQATEVQLQKDDKTHIAHAIIGNVTRDIVNVPKPEEDDRSGLGEILQNEIR